MSGYKPGSGTHDLCCSSIFVYYVNRKIKGLKNAVIFLRASTTPSILRKSENFCKLNWQLGDDIVNRSNNLYFGGEEGT